MKIGEDCRALSAAEKIHEAAKQRRYLLCFEKKSILKSSFTPYLSSPIFTGRIRIGIGKIGMRKFHGSIDMKRAKTGQKLHEVKIGEDHIFLSMLL